MGVSRGIPAMWGETHALRHKAPAPTRGEARRASARVCTCGGGRQHGGAGPIFPIYRQLIHTAKPHILWRLTSRGISRETPHPGKYPGKSPGKFPGNLGIFRDLGCLSRLPGEFPGELSPVILASASDFPGNFPGNPESGEFPGKFGLSSRILLFSPILLKTGSSPCTDGSQYPRL